MSNYNQYGARNPYAPQWVTTTATTSTTLPYANGIYTTPAWVTPSEYRSRLIDPRYYDEALAWDAANPKLTDHQPQRKKTIMSTIAKIKAERQEKKERAEIEALYARYDEIDLDAWDDSTIIRFRWTPDRKDAKTYTYAGVYADEHWYLTGDGLGRPRLTTEEFIDWLVEKRIDHTDIEFYGPVEDED